MSKYYVYLLAILAFTSNASGYRILVIFPHPSYSHQIGQQAVSKGLAENGHQVTIISPNTFKSNNKNIIQIDCSKMYKTWKSFDFSKQISSDNFLEIILKTTPILLDTLLSHEPVQQLIADAVSGVKVFDAVVVENLGYTPIHALAEQLNVPLIGLSTMEMLASSHTAMGNPIHPILHPFYMINNSKVLDFIGKCKRIYTELFMHYWMTYKYLPSLDPVIEKHFKVAKSSAELMNRMDFAIEEKVAELENTRPLLPNTVQIGFLHIRPVQELPPDLKHYLDDSKNGVIYVSFGSNVKSASFSPELRNTLLHTFEALNYDILWKFENETLENRPKNVKIQKWLPQQDILAHKNVKLFVMQGGLQSMEEAIYYGVPMVVLPFFGDQEGNARLLESLEIASSVKSSEVTTELLTNAIVKVVTDASFKSKVKILGDRMKDRPMAPVDTAVWWIEYAIRNYGAEHLKYAGASMSFVEYYLLDVIGAHLVAIFFIFYIFKKLLSFYIFETIRSTTRKTKSKRE